MQRVLLKPAMQHRVYRTSSLHELLVADVTRSCSIFGPDSEATVTDAEREPDRICLYVPSLQRCIRKSHVTGAPLPRPNPNLFDRKSTEWCRAWLLLSISTAFYPLRLSLVVCSRPRPNETSKMDVRTVVPVMQTAI
jgi:hypothetical protein